MERRSDEEWERLVREQLSSGESQKKFCEGRGLSVASFRWRKMKLKRIPAPFVEVAVPEEEEAVTNWNAELELPGGVRFRMNW